MIASPSIDRRWPPASMAARAPTVPWLVLVPVGVAVAMLPFLKPSGPGNTSPVDIPIALSIGVTLFWAGYARQELRLPYAMAVGLIMLGGAVASLAGPLPGNGLLAVVQDLVLLAWCGVIVNVGDDDQLVGPGGIDERGHLIANRIRGADKRHARLIRRVGPITRVALPLL